MKESTYHKLTFRYFQRFFIVFSSLFLIFPQVPTEQKRLGWASFARSLVFGAAEERLRDRGWDGQRGERRALLYRRRSARFCGGLRFEPVVFIWKVLIFVQLAVDWSGFRVGLRMWNPPGGWCFEGNSPMCLSCMHALCRLLVCNGVIGLMEKWELNVWVIFPEDVETVGTGGFSLAEVLSNEVCLWGGTCFKPKSTDFGALAGPSSTWLLTTFEHHFLNKLYTNYITHTPQGK